MKERPIKVIVSGGGTGGHIFPAVSIAKAIKDVHPDADILFVGAEGRMEMQRVPDAGFPIIGLPVAGFDRKRIWRNVSVLIKLLRSQSKARKIIKTFRPDLAIGVGGYASGPVLKAAQSAGIPTFIHESNSFAGVANRLLAKHATKIGVAYEGMERFFPADKLLRVGTPIRQDLLSCNLSPEEARRQFGLLPDKKTVLIVGGSLGARTINQCLCHHLRELVRSDIQFIWQTGKGYYSQAKEALQAMSEVNNIHLTEFVKDMAGAYRAADLVVSRAGAGSIAEFCLLEKPVILIPSPNVAEDHQTMNAMALVNKGAAILVRDDRADEELLPAIFNTLQDEEKLKQLAKHIAPLAVHDSANVIAREVLKLIGE